MEISDAIAAAIFGRALERIALVAVAALSLWLGYRLFFVVPEPSGEIEGLAGESLSVRMKNVAPGTFFALFACALLAYVIANPVELNSLTEVFEELEEKPHHTRELVQFRGSMPVVGDAEGDTQLRDTVRAIGLIDLYADPERPVELDPQERQQLARAIGVLTFHRRLLVDAVEGPGTYEKWQQTKALKEQNPGRYEADVTPEKKEWFEALTSLIAGEPDVEVER